MDHGTDEAMGPAASAMIAADPSTTIDDAVRRVCVYLEALDRRTLGALAPPLTVPQYHALAALARMPRQGVGELATHLLCVKANASGIAERLVALGLVERTSDAADARRVLLSLTPAGARVFTRAIAARAAAFEHLLAPVGAVRRVTMAQAVHDLADLLARGCADTPEGSR